MAKGRSGNSFAKASAKIAPRRASELNRKVILVAPSGRATRAERLDQPLAGGELAGQDIFVRLVGASDIAGTADDRIETGGLVKPGLGAVADGGQGHFPGQIVQQRRQARVLRQ